MKIFARILKVALWASLVFAAFPAAAAPRNVDWSSFLARHDLVWDRMPKTWGEGPFLGNGRLGLMIYEDEGVGALRFDIGSTDAEDHRPGNGGQLNHARLPVGHFILHTVGKTLDTSTFRLDLWNAEARGEIRTTRGTIKLRAYVHATEMATVIEATPTAGEKDFRWEWVGEQADSPRQTFGLLTKETARINPNYQSNPKGVVATDGKVSTYVQPLLVGGGTVTAWQELTGQPTRRLIISTAHSFPNMSASETAVRDVLKAAEIAPDRLVATHRAWWRAWYPKSFLSLSDTRMESFYWIQMYKLASATRENLKIIDDQGPWLQLTPWPYATWNLNVQLTYSPVYAANRLDIGQSLIKGLHENQQTLIDNVLPAYRADSAGIGRTSGSDLKSHVGVPGVLTNPWGDGEDVPAEAGLLTWTLHDAWQQYRYSMDETILRDTVYPLLRRSVNYYRHFLTLGPDGRYHLPATMSPEYGNTPDANFELSLLRWGCQTLLEANEILKANDPLAPQWQDILDRLTDYPQDAGGFMIGAGTPYAKSHRHYSHLLMIYPLYLVNRDQPGGEAVIKRSLDYWRSKPEALQGYSDTGAASISAALGRGDDALRFLQNLQSEFLQPNTLYKESGPVIETPLAGATSIQDMVLQSWGDTIRVFPAVPAAWSDLVIDDLRTEGAFLIGAERQKGATRWITVTSLAGEPLRLLTDLDRPVATIDGKSVRIRRDDKGVLLFDLPKGKVLTLTSAVRPAKPVVHVVPAAAKDVNTYGLNARSPRFKAIANNLKM